MSGSSHYPERVIDLADEFLELCRAGKHPDVGDYQANYPEFANEIGELFPAMAMVEGISLRNSSGREESSHSKVAPQLQSLPFSFGDFRVIRELGRGGMGVVYEAEQISLRRRVALKLMGHRQNSDPATTPRFKRESYVAAGLHHSNIVPVFTVGEHDGIFYYAMQFIDGWPLDVVISELGHEDKREATPAEANSTGGKTRLLDETTTMSTDLPSSSRSANDDPLGETKNAMATHDTTVNNSLDLSQSSTWKALHDKSQWKSIANVGMQIADALDYAHRKNVIHRDVKPANLLVDQQGTVWLTDFGLAKIEDDLALTRTGDVLGTLRYMPPEAFEGKYDDRGDIYSAGLTIYELLARRRAFSATSREQLVAQISQSGPPSIRTVCIDIPRDLETIVNKAIAHDASQRYQSARELAADLRRFQNDEPVFARRPTPIQTVSRWTRKNPWKAGFLTTAATFALVTFVASFLFFQSQHDRTVKLNQELASSIAETERLLSASDRAPLDRERLNDALASLERSHYLSEQRRSDPALRDKANELTHWADRLADSRSLYDSIQSIQFESDKVDFEQNSIRYTPALEDYRKLLKERSIISDESASEGASVVLEYPQIVQESIVHALDRLIAFTPDRVERNAYVEVAQQIDKNPFRSNARRLFQAHDLDGIFELTKQDTIDDQDSVTLGLIGMYLREYPNRKGVLDFLRRVQSEHPDDFTLNYRLALVLSNGSADEQWDALSYASAALAIRPNNPGIRLTHANLLHKCGKHESSYDALQSLVSDYPNYSSARVTLVRVLADLGKHDEISRVRSEIDGMTLVTPQLFTVLGTYYYDQLDLATAEQFHRKAIELDPYDSTPHNNLAATLLIQGRYQEALVSAANAIELDAAHSYAWANKGLVEKFLAFEEEDRAKREALLQQAESSLAHSVELVGSGRFERRSLADFYVVTDRLETALQVWEQWKFRGDTHPTAFIEQALIYFNQGDLEGAQVAIAKARLRGANEIELSALDGELLVRQGDPSAAIERLEEAHTQFPTVRTLRYLAMAYHQTGQYGRSLAAHRILAECNPIDSNVLKRYAFAASHLGEFEESIQVNQRLLDKQPDEASAFYNIGNAHQRLMQCQEAIEAYRKALEIRPSFAEAHVNLAQTLQKSGDLESALDHYSKADAIGSQRARWPYPTARLVREIEVMIEIERAIRAGDTNTTTLSINSQIGYAQVALLIQEYETSAVIFQQAYQTGINPQIFANNYHLAACACSMASMVSENESEGERLRDAARNFLAENIEAFHDARRSATPTTRIWVELTLWQRDPRLAAIRDSEYLSRLSQEERVACQTLWSDIEGEIEQLRKLDSQEFPFRQPL